MRPVCCAGVGLHSGAEISMTLKPAPLDTGIVFARIDKGNVQFPALYDRVFDTTLGTSLGEKGGVSIGTVEHLMAALWGCEVDNVLIELDGPEVPAMDGSAAPFVALIEETGTVGQGGRRGVIKVARRVEVVDKERSIALIPTDNFSVDLSIDFKHKAIACQSSFFDGSPLSFKTDISGARTFGFAKEVEALRAAGLAKGGCLENSIVLGDEDTGIINKGGLRYENEFARHKVLDCVGDLYLAGRPLVARVVAHRSGHELNNAILRELFSSEDNWTLESPGAAPVEYHQLHAVAQA